MKRPLRARPSLSTRAGFALVDVSISLLILVIAMGTLLGTVFSALRLSQVTEDTATANQAVRGILETMNALPLEQIFAAYNDDRADDPDPNRDYRNTLAIPKALLAGEGGQAAVASVRFPVVDGQLREDVVDPGLGMPRDLNGDDIDALDHSGDYTILPVSIRLEWRGPSGTQVLEISTVLGNQ